MKKWLMTGAVVLAAGVMLFAIPFAMTGFQIDALNTVQPYEQKSVTFSGEIHSITVEDAGGKIVLGPSTDGKLHVTYGENDKDRYEITPGPDFVIRRVTHYEWYDHIFQIDFQERVLTMLIPEGMTGDIVVRDSNGVIQAKDLSVGHLSLTTSNGAVEVERIAASSLEVETSNGPIHLTEIKAKGSVSGITRNGTITYQQVEGTDIDADTSNGRVELTNVGAKSKLTADSSNGAIKLSDAKAGEQIRLKTSNGAIQGTLAGRTIDYTITSKTSNGANNLPESLRGGDIQLNVKTSNGPIDIQFSDD